MRTSLFLAFGFFLLVLVPDGQADAIGVFKKLEAMEQEGQEPPAMAIWQNQMTRGEEAFHQGDFRKAEPLFKRAWLLVRHYGPKDYRFAISLEHYSWALNRLNKKEEALALHQDALRLREITFGETSEEAISSLLMIALQQVDLKRLEDADETIEKYLETNARRYGPQSGEFANALDIYADFLKDTGRTKGEKEIRMQATNIRKSSQKE